MAKKKRFKTRIVKCYDIEITDENGYMVDYYTEYGDHETAQFYCYGDRKKAEKEANKYLEEIKKRLGSE